MAGLRLSTAAMPARSLQATPKTRQRSGMKQRQLLQQQLHQEEKKNDVFLTNFTPVSPPLVRTQEELHRRLIAIHSESAAARDPSSLHDIEAKVDKYCCKAPNIEQRGFYSSTVFSPSEELPDLTARMEVHADVATNQIFEQALHSKVKPTHVLMHVTCTGYDSPTPAQRFASHHGWNYTLVRNCYHHGCYAAVPAVEMSAALLSPGSGYSNATIVHTELCSLHVRAAQTVPSAERCVFQSLFSDGAIAYDLLDASANEVTLAQQASLKLLAVKEILLPDSLEHMTWMPNALNFEMSLSKVCTSFLQADALVSVSATRASTIAIASIFHRALQEVPSLLMSNLDDGLKQLLQKAGVRLEDENIQPLYAIHPGGSKILDFAQQRTMGGLADEQLHHSREVLRLKGNMSSATLPHVWHGILNDPAVPDQTLVLSAAFGPGLTLSMAAMRVHKPGY